MRRAALFLATSALALDACAGPGSTLEPGGRHAARIAELTWLMTGIATAIVVLVAAILAMGLLRRSWPALWPAGRLSDRAIIVGGGILLPAIVLPFLWAVTLRDLGALADAPSPPVVTIEITAHQWWYEVHYPEHDLTLRDELYLPAGRTVLLRVTSADVIHSFWAPRLAGKIDMIPGRMNEVWVEAAEPGRYLVECAEFCGLWHARMHMSIVAEAPADFATRMAGGE